MKKFYLAAATIFLGAIALWWYFGIENVTSKGSPDGCVDKPAGERSAPEQRQQELCNINKTMDEYDRMIGGRSKPKGQQ